MAEDGQSTTVLEPKTLAVERLGLVDFDTALDRQLRYHGDVVRGERCDTLIVCSHPPVYTMGTSTKAEHVGGDIERPELGDTPLRKVDRGGSVTYHGPEQIVLYPILDLNRHKRDIGWYMRCIEEVAIRTLSDFGIPSYRIVDKTGVWTDESSKIAFCGVKVSRWCTRHGLSINVLPARDRFAVINPCGLGAIRVISMQELTGRNLDPAAVQESAIAHFAEVFGYAGRFLHS